MKKFSLIVALIVMYIAIQLNAQQLNYVANYPNYSIDLRKAGSNSPFSMGGLFTYNGSVVLYEIGKLAATPTYAHGVYQWNIIDLEIPNGSTIHSVTVSFNYTMFTVENTTLNYFNCGSDITNTNLDLAALWNSTDKTLITPIGEGGYSKQGNQLYVKTTFNNGSSFVTQFANSINQNDRFTLGIAWKYESPEAGVVSWYFRTGGLYPSISVSYTPPSQMVTLDQRLSNNTQVGKLRKWEGTEFTPSPYINPGTPFDFPVNSVQTIQGDQAIYSNEKYNNWNADKTDIKNHHGFTITPLTNTLTSKFEGTQPDITIKNNLESSPVNGGDVQFKDPWLIDYPDSLYGYNLRNRGMDDAGPDKLEFKSRPSPFYPDYSTSYSGDVYQGVFLKQGYDEFTQIWTPPYYQVKAESPQPIYVQGKTRNFYFHKWEGTGASFQSSANLETPVVFNQANATVKAVMKGTQLSSMHAT
ncbi:MAG: hypothetical protein ABIG69_19165, partial [Bacteroidota bacterium]